MVLSRNFRTTIMARAQEDQEYRREMLIEAVNLFLEGDVMTGKAHLRDYINATVGFAAVAGTLGKHSKSIQRMLSPSGNPGLDSIMPILKILQDYEGIRLKVTHG